MAQMHFFAALHLGDFALKKTKWKQKWKENM